MFDSKLMHKFKLKQPKVLITFHKLNLKDQLRNHSRSLLLDPCLLGIITIVTTLTFYCYHFLFIITIMSKTKESGQVEFCPISLS